MIDSNPYPHFPYRSHGLILQEEVNHAKGFDMAGLVIALVLFIGLPALALRFGSDSRLPSSWSPQSDWRERDPRS
jgi:hypothetical protein